MHLTITTHDKLCSLWIKLVFNSDHTSIMHRFRYNQVLPLAGNEVIVLSPRGGAAGKF